MTIAQYTQAKFAIADILRAAAAVARARHPDARYPFEDLFARLAEDRFNVALVGQFNRGKTSLINAMLNTDCLPTGIIPLTSVITTVQYGTDPCAVIEYVQGGLPSRITLDKLGEFVTQCHNPGNRKGVRFARVEFPAEILRQGFYLIDTPGLASAIVENSRTTENFLPEVDAFVIVTSYDSPLSEQELRLSRMPAAAATRCFVVLNKMDMVDDADRPTVESHVRARLSFGGRPDQPEIYSVSAREALIANRTNDAARLVRSGLPALVTRIESFVIREKNSIVLHRMAERIDQELAALGCVYERKRLADLVVRLAGTDPGPSGTPPARRSLPRFEHCAVCAPMEREFRRFLETFQYRIIVEDRARRELHAQGGLCPLHLWHYAALASSHGTCVAFPGVFDRMLAAMAGGLKVPGASAGEIVAKIAGDVDCILCRVRSGAEQRAVAGIAAEITRSGAQSAPVFPDICLHHLVSVAMALPDDLEKGLFEAIGESWQRTADDMRRYALKRDGSRRALTTNDELDADVRGLRALGGHAALSFARALQR